MQFNLICRNLSARKHLIEQCKGYADGESARHSVRGQHRFGGGHAADVHSPRRGVNARIVRADERVLDLERRGLAGVEPSEFADASQRDARGFNSEHRARSERGFNSIAGVAAFEITSPFLRELRVQRRRECQSDASLRVIFPRAVESDDGVGVLEHLRRREAIVATLANADNNAKVAPSERRLFEGGEQRAVSDGSPFEVQRATYNVQDA